MAIDELWALGIYYSKSLACCAVATGVMGLALFFAKRKNGQHTTVKLTSWLLWLPTLVWLMYFSTTFRDSYAITSLDDEDDKFAQAVYRSSFDIGLDKAIKLAVDPDESGNVRFYASCRVADLLVTNDDHMKSAILDRVKDTPDFETGFFSTNQLTCGFFTPNYAEGPFTVSEIITKRLQAIRTAKTHQTESVLK